MAALLSEEEELARALEQSLGMHADAGAGQLAEEQELARALEQSLGMHADAGAGQLAEEQELARALERSMVDQGGEGPQTGRVQAEQELARALELSMADQNNDEQLERALALSLRLNSQASVPEVALSSTVSYSNGAFRSAAVNVTSIAGLLLFRGGARLRALEYRLGVTVTLRDELGMKVNLKRASRRYAQLFLEVAGADESVVEVALNKVTQILADPAEYNAQCKARNEEVCFVFVDNSNIFHSAQLVADDSAPPAEAASARRQQMRTDLSIRLDLRKLIEVVEDGRANPKLRFVSGSRPPAAARIWECYRECGYSVHLETRVEGCGEQRVDETIHAKAAVCLNNDYGHKKHTLILLTGDGNSNSGRSSFLDIVEIAMRKNAAKAIVASQATETEEINMILAGMWHVEIVTWRASCNPKYKALAAWYPDHVHLRWLDDYRDYICYRAKPRVYREPRVVPLCTFNNTGICRNGSSCSRAHEACIDGDACENERCTLGHPRSWVYKPAGMSRLAHLRRQRNGDDVEQNRNRSHQQRSGGAAAVAEVVDPSASDEENSEDDSEESACRLCWDREPNHALMPCGHTGLCEECVPSVIGDACPFCRQVVTGSLRLYET